MSNGGCGVWTLLPSLSFQGRHLFVTLWGGGWVQSSYLSTVQCVCVGGCRMRRVDTAFPPMQCREGIVHPSLECPKSLDCLWFFINSLHMKTTKGLQWNPFVEECEGCSWNVYPVPICHRLWFLSLTGNPCRYMTNKNTLIVPLHCCIWQERKLLPWIIIHYYWSSRWATLNKLLGYPITLDNIDGKPYLQSIYGPTLNIALFLECMQLFLASLEILRMFCLRRNI